MLKICIYISISSSFHLNHLQNYEANTLSNLWLNGIANCSEKPVAYSSLTFIIISENFYFIFRVPDPNCFLTVSMQPKEAESSRLLDALEKKQAQSMQRRADAISFGSYRKDGGDHV